MKEKIDDFGLHLKNKDILMNSSAMKHSFRLSALVLGTLASSGAVAQGFTAVELSSGYELSASTDPVNTNAKTTTPAATDKSIEHKCGEGKCGEGKCGEGKCGEGKCGEGKCGEGKCGEGKCGEEKPADAKTEVKATKEAKCGGMI
jgi:uncharacterized low-complexity protein